MKKADILSRLAQLEDRGQDNLKIILLPERMFNKVTIVFKPIPQGKVRA